MDRLAKILARMDMGGSLGMEIGALQSPILRRPDAHVIYVDRADTKTLRQAYASDPDVAVDGIVDVDIVWRDEELESLVGGRRFDHVVASHVCEHVPDLVWWLSELRSVLKPYGSVRLVVPDKRYTFDHARSESTIADLLAAFVDRRRRPGSRDILDFWLSYQAVDRSAAWRGHYPAPENRSAESVRTALGRAIVAKERGTYQDVHCWVFTPSGFVSAMAKLAELDLLGFACTDIHDTAPHEIDFFVHLMKADDRTAIAESWRWAAWKITQPDIEA